MEIGPFFQVLEVATSTVRLPRTRRLTRFAAVAMERSVVALLLEEATVRARTLNVLSTTDAVLGRGQLGQEPATLVTLMVDAIAR